VNNAELAEAREKLRQAEKHLGDATNVRALIALGSLPAPDENDPADVGRADELAVELHVADVRVDLWRQVVAELRERLGIR
jgi:hypothetical protein